MKELSSLTLLLTTLFTITLFTGCSNDDPSSPDNVTIVVPAKGSSFTYTSYGLDNQGVKESNSEGNEVATVEETDLSIYGKTGVMKSVEVSDRTWPADTTYMKYESNGDVSFYNNVRLVERSGGELWITLPYGSRTNKTVTFKKTVGVVNGDTAVIDLTIVTEWIRNEKVTIQGEEMDVWIADTKTTGSIPVGIDTTVTVASVNSTSTNYFVPQLGYLYRVESNSIIGGRRNGSGVRLLLSYVLA